MPIAVRDIPNLTNEQISRFLSHVALGKSEDCWEWTGFTKWNGYGEVCIHYKKYTAHRIAWVIAKGGIPDGMVVCHTCDNRKCVNPNHLFLGTQADNLADMRSKGRYRPPNRRTGVDHPMAKLTNKDVLEIRDKYKPFQVTSRMLAEEYGVSITQIKYIIQRKYWNHI